MGFGCVSSAVVPHARTFCWGYQYLQCPGLGVIQEVSEFADPMWVLKRGETVVLEAISSLLPWQILHPPVWVADGAQGRVGYTGLLMWLTHDQFPVKAVALLSLTATTIINSFLGLNREQAIKMCEDWCSLPARMLEAAKAVTACTEMRKASAIMDFSEWQGNSSKPRITIS